MSGKEQVTELKIKEAARKIFQEKGFAATKTRDIAEAADINLALLNYYFRSKKNLFNIIMIETMRSFASGIVMVLNNKETALKEKVEDFVEHYIDLLTENPNVAPFILNSVRENPEEFLSKVGVLDRVKKSIFIKQFQEGLMKGEIPPINPIHFLVNMMGLVIFPFIAQPMVSAVSGMEKEIYFETMQERKRLIPLWIEATLTVK